MSKKLWVDEIGARGGVDPRIEAYLGLKGKPMNFEMPKVRNVKPGLLHFKHARVDAPMIPHGFEGMVVKPNDMLGQAAPRHRRDPDQNIIKQLAEQMRGVPTADSPNTITEDCYSKVSNKQELNQMQSQFNKIIKETLAQKHRTDAREMLYTRIRRDLDSTRCGDNLWVHPFDKTKVVQFTHNGDASMMIMRWATANNISWLPHIIEEYTGYEEDGDAFHIVVRKNLDRRNPDIRDHRSEAGRSANYFQSSIFGWLEGLIDHENLDTRLKDYKTFLAYFRKASKKRAAQDPRHHHLLDINGCIRNHKFLKEVYNFMVLFHPVCSFCIYSSDIRSDGNQIVLTHIGRTLNHGWKHGLSNVSDYKVKPIFRASFNGLEDFSMMPAVNIGTTDVSIKYRKAGATTPERTLQSFYTKSI